MIYRDELTRKKADEIHGLKKLKSGNSTDVRLSEIRYYLHMLSYSFCLHVYSTQTIRGDEKEANKSRFRYMIFTALALCMSTLLGRLHLTLNGIAFWIGVVMIFIVLIGYLKPRSPGAIRKSVISLHDAHWNDFARIVCDAAFSNWNEIGDHLGYEWQTLEGIRERGQGSKKDCRFLLAKYAEENGNSVEAREKVVDVCVDIRIGGRLKDVAAQNGYFLNY